MPDSALFSRTLFRAAFAACAVGLLASCATKKKSGAPKVAAATESKPEKEKSTPTPTPVPSPTPKPEPTPEARYIARVSVEGGEATEAVLTPDGQATPEPSASPAPEESPAPTPSPSPAPSKPEPMNFLASAWQKIFPPKPTPAPTPGETGRIRITTSVGDGGESGPANFGADAGAVPTPTPLQIKLKPTEGFLMRMWHKIVPKKKEPPMAAPPQWIGTIKLINERDGYALIDSQTYFAMPDGETLNSVGADTESGVLRVTSDRNPPFFIADIVSGKPRAGDRVYSPKP